MQEAGWQFAAHTVREGSSTTTVPTVTPGGIEMVTGSFVPRSNRYSTFPEGSQILPNPTAESPTEVRPRAAPKP